MWWPFSKPPPGAGCRIVETLPSSIGMTTQHISTKECFNEIITTAKKYICIVSFCCNLRTTQDGIFILNGLIGAAQSGIKVTVLVDSNSKSNDEEELTSNKIVYKKVKVNNDGGVVLGNFWVSDDARFYIGNASLTGGSISTIKTLGVYSNYAPLAVDVKRRFDTLNYLNYASSTCYSCCCLPLSTEYHIHNPIGGVFLSDSPEHLLGCYRTLNTDVVISKLRSAKSSIDIELLSLVPVVRSKDEVIYWPDIYNELIAAAINRGVKIRLLVGSWHKNDAYAMSSIKSLRAICGDTTDLTIRLFSPQNNTKLMIVDENFAHITSANFDGSHYLYHAFVSLNFVDPGLVKTVSEIFNRDWDSHNTKPLN